jgi:hypothetical protein
MKTAMTALAAVAATTAAATTASFCDDTVSPAESITVSAATDVRPHYPAAPYPGYIVYPNHAAALPNPTCYWTRMPIYDLSHNVIGWRGRPIGICPRVSAQAK